MKSKLIMFLFAVLVLGAIPAQAQDAGDPDTVLLIATRPTAGDTTFKVELYFWNDSQALASATMGFGFDNDNVNIDSAAFAPGITTIFPISYLFFANDIAQSNDSNWVTCQLARLSNVFLAPTDPPSRQLIATYYFSVTNWDIAQTITFDTLALNAGSTFKLNDTLVNDIIPAWAGPLTLRDPLDAGNGGAVDNLPKEFSVAQNYPNPFNPTTTIEFALPVASDYSVKIYNVTGRQVKEITGVAKAAGNYSVEWDASNNASGVYFYKVAAGDFSKTMKMMLLK